MKALFFAFVLMGSSTALATSVLAQPYEIVSYDVNQRIKELGGGPFCINQFDGWQKGEPQNMHPFGRDANTTCNTWAAGQMSSDRRSKSAVAACTCR